MSAATMGWGELVPTAIVPSELVTVHVTVGPAAA